MQLRNDTVDTGANTASSSFRQKPLVRSIQRALLPGLLAGLATTPLAAAPSGGQVRAGNAAISHDAAHGVTTIKQNSQRTAIDWRSFDVGPHEQVRFKQPNAKATALNRIFNQQPTEIFGKVKANGRVVLMNPNGVFFRPGAEVNVGGLIAGAMRVGVDEFMSGRYQLKGQDGSDGRVVNQGTITALPGGTVALVGKTIANEGAIVATAGRVNLVAGEQTTVDFDGDGLLRFKVDKAVVDNAAKLADQVANSGQISADGGQILITASAAAGVFDQAINNSGVIKAGRITKRGGKILLLGAGPTASVLNTGQLDASAATANDDGGGIAIRSGDIHNAGGMHADAQGGDGGTIDIAARATAVFEQASKVTATSADGTGGEVNATGRQLAFNFDAQVDVSGAKGGGRAQLGGGLHGENSKIANAQAVFVSSAASIKADATKQGDGGEVTVWSDDTTYFHGQISAQGGQRGGDGGFVEVSGKQNLLYRGAVDTRAARGTTGSLVLDPATLTITDAATAGEEASFLPSVDAADDNAGGLNTISWGDIDAQAATTNVVLEASGLVTVNDVVGVAGGSITGNNAVHLDLLTTGSLTLRSTAGNIVFADTDDVIETKGGAITLSAANGTVTAGGLRTNVAGGNGAVAIISNGNVSFGDITTGGAVFSVNIASGTATQVTGKDIAGATALTKLGAGTLTLGNANSYTGVTLVNGGRVLVTDGGGLGGNGSTTVASGAVLEIDNVDINSEALNLAGGTLRAAGSADSDGNFTLNANSVIDVTGAELIIDGVISGAGFGIDKQGSGQLTLGNANTYTGTTIITAGSIVAAVDNVFAASVLNIAGGAARFEMETSDQTVAGLSGAGVVSNDDAGGAAKPVTLTINGGNGQTFTGGIFNSAADDISIVKTGVGTQTFSIGATTYAGALTINNGTLSVTTANSLGDAADATMVSGNGTLNLNGLALASPETIEFEGSGIGNVGALTVTGSASIASSVVLTMTNNATIGGSGSDTLTLNTELDNGGSAALTKTGTGTLILASDNSTAFTGAAGTITVNAGVLKVTDSHGLGDALGTTTVANDAQLEFALGASNTVAENLSIEGNGGASAALLHSSGNVLTLSGTVTLTNVGVTDDATISVSNGVGELQIANITDGAASLALTKAGAGTLLLTAAGDYNGVTHITGGTLKAGVANVLVNGTGLDIASGGVFNLAGFSQAVDKLDGALGALVTNDAGATNAVATLNITAGGGGYAGDISENGSDTLSLLKSGSGSQSLSVVTGTYDGTTSVTGGVLSITTAASLGTATGATMVNGGTLALNASALTDTETIHLSGTGNGGSGALTASGTANIASSNSVVLDADATIGGSGTLEMDAVISENGGARSLTKAGAVSLVLSGNNSYTGATVVTAGTLRAGAADVLDTSSGLNLSGVFTTFNMAGFDQSLQKLDGISSSVLRNDAGNTGNSATLTITAGGGSFAGSLIENGSDQLALTKSASGTQILAGGGNAYSGATTVSGGTLQAGAADLLAQSAGLNLSSAGATFNLAGFNQSLIKLDGVAGAGLSNDAGNTSDVATLTITGGGGSYLGNIIENGSDTLSITKSNTGTQVLAVGSGTNDGATTVTGGTLQVLSAASFGSSLGGIVINNASDAAATLDLATPGATTIGDAITFAGGNNPTLLHSTLGTTTLTGGIVMSSAGTVNVAQAAGTLAVTTVGISGVGTLTKSGSGTLQIGVATSLGGFNLSQGVLAIGLANALAASTNLTLAAGTSFNLHGFNQTIASLSGTGTVTNDDTVGASNGAATLTIAAGGGSFSGVITESADDVLALTKSGTGTQILASANSYTGVTTIAGGTLQAGAANILSNSSGLNLTASAATFNLAGFDQSVGAMTGITGSVVTNNAGNVGDVATLILTSNGGSFAGNIAQTATDTLSLTKTGAGTQILSGTANTYAGVTTVNSGILQAGANNALGATSGLVLNGAGTTFNLAGFDQQVGTLDGGAGTVVTNNAGNTANAATLTISGGGGNFAGDITQTGSDTLSLAKTGSGIQTLAVLTGTYDGATTVSGGTLKIDTVASLGSTLGQTTASTGTLDLGALALASGETLNVSGTGNGGVGALIGTASVAASNAIVLSGTGAIGTTGTLTINSVIAGTGNLSKVDAGNLILTGANTFTGSAAVAQGTLTAGAANVLNASASLSVASGASFNLAGFAQAVKKLDGVVGAVVTNNAGGGGTNATLAITAGGGSYAGDLTQNGLDDLSVTKSGSGSQSLSVMSGTYAGATLISGGTLSITTAASLGTASGQTTADGGSLDLNGLALASNEAINLRGTGNGGAGALTGTGTASVANTNAVTLSADASIGVTGTLTLTTALGESGGARSVTKTGAGTLILANANNTYSGATLVDEGTLQAGASDVLDNSTGLDLTAAGATFNLAGFDQVFSKLDGVAGSVVTNNAAALADVARLDITAGGGSFAGDMTETGGDTLSLVKSGTGTQVLSVGSGTYNGTTTITGGSLRVATTASLGSANGATTVNGGTLEASFTDTSNESLILNGSGNAGAGALRGTSTGTFAGAVSLASASTISVDNGAAGNIDFTVSGAISGGVGSTLTKTGADSLVLAGNNNYAGATQIDVGTLKLGAATGIGGASVVSIAAGATFDVNNENGVIGALGGGSGTLDLGLGSLAAAGDIDLSGITVVLAASGTGNQTLSAGTDGSGTLTIEGLSKASGGNLTLVSPTLIDINGDVVVSAGNLSITDAFNLASDLTASGNITLAAVGSLDGSVTQTIDAQGGTLSTVGLTKVGRADGDLILGGGTAITATGDINVQSVDDDLIVADDISTDNNLSAARNVIFQGTGSSTFNGIGAQRVTAGSGAIRDTAGAVLAKSGGSDLILTAGSAIGVSSANGLGVALSGGSGLQANTGTNLFVTSAVALRINALDTGAGADTVDIRSTGATASLTMAGPYNDIVSDNFTLVAARDLNFIANTLTLATLDASFGQSGTASDLDIDQLVSASGPGGFTLSGGAASGDRIDASGLAVDLDFVSSALNAGSVGNGLVINGFSAIETLVGGSGNDSLADNGSYTVTGANAGSASLLGGSWSAIENLTGSSAANTFNIATGGSLSGTIDGRAGIDNLSYASRGTAVTIDLATLTAPNVGAFVNIETFVGGSGGADTLLGTAHVSKWTVSAANSGAIDDTTVGVEFNFAGFERLTGGAAADTFTISAAGSASGLITGGGGIDRLTYASRASAVTVNLQSATVADGSSTFANFTGIEILAGSAAATDKLVGRNQTTDWNLTASGAGTLDDTPSGAPDGTPEIAFTAFETLQGGNAIDTFTAATGGALSFTQLAGGAGNDIFMISKQGTSTVLNTSIVGETDDDTVFFGAHENSPPLNPSSNEFSRVTGSIGLGAGIDTLDYSGSDLVLVNTFIDNGTGTDSGQSGTVRDASINNPPNLSLLSGSYSDVDAVIGNGTQLQGADAETVWIITGNGRGRHGSSFATATTTFENFSIRGGDQRDVFIFKPEGTSNLTPQLLGGIDGGDFVAGTPTTHNYLLGSRGADQMRVTGANAVSITVTGGSGAATTAALNINHIGDASLSVTSGFSDGGADGITVQAGRTWAGNILTNGGDDTVTLGAGARIAGTLNLGAGRDAVDASAYTTAITARVTSANASGMSASTSSFAGDFVGIESLDLGRGGDTVILTVAPSGTANTISMGPGGGDTLNSQVDATWVLTSNGAGQLRGLPGNAGDQIAFSGVDNLSTNGDAALSVPGAAASIAGTFTAASVSMVQAAIDVGSLGLRIAGDVTSSHPLTLTASGQGDIAIRGNVQAGGAFTSKVVAGTASFDDVITTGANQTYSGTTTVRGDLTARDVAFGGATRVNGDMTVRDAVFSASADLRGPISGRNLTFNGNTSLRTDVSGEDLHFNGPLTIINSVKLLSSSNIFDFNDEVSSDTNAVLSIVPSANTDMFIDLNNGPGHIAANRFGQFKGTLAIGGEFGEAPGGDSLNGTIRSAPADYLTVSESLLTGGDVVLIGSTVDFSKGRNIMVGAGNPGEGTIVVMALGDKVQAGNNGLAGRVTLGNIAAPSGANKVTFTGGRVMLAATNEVDNSQNIVMNLGGGEVLVAQGARATKTRVDFNVLSRAQNSTINVTDTGLIKSLTALGAPQNLLQNTRASFPNPAAILTILQAVAFVDSSLFEEDLTLFGVIGDGIAKSLDQCEDAEACAPSVTQEQLTALIDGLTARIAALERSLATGDISAAKGDALLSQYRSELASYLDYQQQLRAYVAKQQQDDVGGNEFEDVFEAEEKTAPAAQPPTDAATKDAPAADAPALDEGSEDLFAPLEDAPPAPVQTAPEPPPGDVDEDFETLDESPAPVAPQTAPAAPVRPSTKENAPAPADDFEELEEFPDAILLNEVLSTHAVNQLAGLVRLDAEGAVIWSGEVILPTLHRRY